MHMADANPMVDVPRSGVARAHGLLGAAEAMLAAEPGEPRLKAVQERVRVAVEALGRPGAPTDATSFTDVARAVAEAVEAAGHPANLPARQAQALMTIGHALSILTPVPDGASFRDSLPAVRPPPLPPQHEKRQSPRMVLQSEVGFETESNFYTGFIEDISEGGIFVATWELLPRGSEVDVELELPTGHIVRGRAIVRWLRDLRDEQADSPPGMGMQFCDLLVEDRNAINTFIATRSPLFFDP